MSKGLKMSESKTVGKRGTWCVLVSSLNSQVNSRNHFCARHINTFRKPCQWFIHWRTYWWQLELLQCHSHWKGHQFKWWSLGLFPNSDCCRGGLTAAPASCTHARAPTCLPVKGMLTLGRKLWSTRLQFQPLGILNTWWLEIHRFSVLFVSLSLWTMDVMNDEF